MWCQIPRVCECRSLAFLLTLVSLCGTLSPLLCGADGAQNSQKGSASVLQELVFVQHGFLQLRGGSAPNANVFGAAHNSPQQGSSAQASGNSADLLSQLSKDTLQAELERRGCDSVGAKSVLAIRLNRIMSEGGKPNAGDHMHAQSGTGGAGEGDMMDVDAAGKSATPIPSVNTGPPGRSRRMDSPGQRRGTHRDKRGRRGNLGERDATRSWEGLKSGSMKVSTPTRRTPFQNSRGGRGVGREHASDGQVRSSSSKSEQHAGVDAGGWRGGGEGRGRYPTRRGGRGRWRARGGREGRGAWLGGGDRTKSPQQRAGFVSTEATGWKDGGHQRQQGRGEAGGQVKHAQADGEGGSGVAEPSEHIQYQPPQVIVAGAQVGEKFGRGDARNPTAAGAGGSVHAGAFARGDGGQQSAQSRGHMGGGYLGQQAGVIGGNLAGAGEGGVVGGGGVAGGVGGAFGSLPPLPPLPTPGMGDDSL